MDFTTNLIEQTMAGLAGAHLAAMVFHEHRFGWLGHSLVGLIAGALGGIFLQQIALTVVTGSGSLNQPRLPEIAVIEGLTGVVAPLQWPLLGLSSGNAAAMPRNRSDHPPARPPHRLRITAGQYGWPASASKPSYEAISYEALSVAKPSRFRRSH
jgi:uncharacterized membrane protein YeaQ/YmgE (transglycosylase-associated protein family)